MVQGSSIHMSYLAFVEYLKLSKVWVIVNIKAISCKNKHFLLYLELE